METVGGQSQYRTGTTSLILTAGLTQTQLREDIRDTLSARLAETGEFLGQFDYGPPRRTADPRCQSFDVMYRTGPESICDGGPSLEREPPQLDA